MDMNAPMPPPSAEFSALAKAVAITPHGAIQHAVENLRHAAADKNSDSLCAAYLELRQAAKGIAGEQLISLSSRTLGEAARDILGQAFAQAGCYMCRDGTAECLVCNGTGEAVPGRRCTHCEGLPVACGFCRGTAWADQDSIPVELRHAVTARHLARVRSDMIRLKKTFSTGDLDQKLSRLDASSRRAVTGWLIRLDAQIHELIQRNAITDKAEIASLRQADQQIEEALDTLSRKEP